MGAGGLCTATAAAMLCHPCCLLSYCLLPPLPPSLRPPPLCLQPPAASRRRHCPHAPVLHKRQCRQAQQRGAGQAAHTAARLPSRCSSTVCRLCCWLCLQRGASWPGDARSAAWSHCPIHAVHAVPPVAACSPPHRGQGAAWGGPARPGSGGAQAQAGGPHAGRECGRGCLATLPSWRRWHGLPKQYRQHSTAAGCAASFVLLLAAHAAPAAPSRSR